MTSQETSVFAETWGDRKWVTFRVQRPGLDRRWPEKYESNFENCEEEDCNISY